MRLENEPIQQQIPPAPWEVEYWRDWNTALGLPEGTINNSQDYQNYCTDQLCIMKNDPVLLAKVPELSEATVASLATIAKD